MKNRKRGAFMFTHCRSEMSEPLGTLLLVSFFGGLGLLFKFGDHAFNLSGILDVLGFL